MAGLLGRTGRQATSPLARIACTPGVPRAFATGKPQVLLMDEINLARKDLERLEANTQVLRNNCKTREELIDAFCKDGPYANISGLYRHFGGAKSVRISGRFDTELVAHLPKSLRFIVHNGSGYDQLDVDALSERQIQAANVPTIVNDATADTALFLLLGAMRRFPLALGQRDTGHFNTQFPFTTAHNPEGRVLGIVGAGGIGRTLARKAAHALGMKVLYHNRRQLSADVEAEGMPEGQPLTYVHRLDELLERSDVVSLNCPLTPETKHLIGADELAKMKNSAILVNTARGPVIDEAALAEALEHDMIAGAGLDVYEAEPKIHPALYALKDSKALLLPHVGTLTLETQTEMESICIRNLEHGLETGKLLYTVPEQKGVDFGLP